MNVDLLLGIGALGYGVFSVYLRMTNPEKFGKLAAMKEKWGATAGTIVHWIAYTIVPLVAGVVLLLSGLSGK